jgi:hypothetical protein
LIHDGRTIQSLEDESKLKFFPGAHIGNGFWTTAGFDVCEIAERLATKGGTIAQHIGEESSAVFNFSSPTTFRTFGLTAGFQYMPDSIFQTAPSPYKVVGVHGEGTEYEGTESSHEGNCGVVVLALERLVWADAC